MILLLEIEEVRELLVMVAPLVDPDNPDPFSGANSPVCTAASQLLEAMSCPDQIDQDDLEALLHDDTVLAVARHITDRMRDILPPYLILRGKIHGITVFDNQGTLAIHTHWR